MKTSKCVGIDLGTTNSVIAMVADDNKTILCRTDKTGRKTFPSVVVYDAKTNGIRAGQVAFNRRGTSPEPIVSIKRHMGDSNYRATCGPLSLEPVEVSAEILRTMKEQMQEYLNGIPAYQDYVVDRAVITIPAYFASNAREATTKAGELAGFQVEFTLGEPTASALYYCYQNGIKNGIFMVYDLGGGTFDVSIVRLSEGDAFVLGIAGDNYLGGDNFDETLAWHLLRTLQDPAEGYDLDLDVYQNEEDRQRFTRLKLEAEIIKKALSSKEEHYETADGIFRDKSGATVNLAVTVTRAEFEAMIDPLLQPTIDECYKALREAEEKHDVTLDMIDGVLLVGGSTHVPMVSRLIEQTFTDPALPVHTKWPKPLKDEPDMAVGYGAAIAAASRGTVRFADGSVEHEGESLRIDATFQPGRGYGGVSIVEGRITAVDGALPDGMYAKVERAAGGFTREYLVQKDGSFLFDGLVSVQEKEPYAATFFAGNTPVLEATFDAAVFAVGDVPVVLSRNYFIETVREASGDRHMVRLMEKGTQLPCSRDYEFRVNSKNPYFSELKFYEESKFLKQVNLSFDPPVPPSTTIRLSLACDLSSRFTARAEAAGIVVDVAFEQSPPPELPTQNAMKLLLESVLARIDELPVAGERIVAQTRAKKLFREIEQAINEGDACKADEKKEELRDIGNILPPPPKELRPARYVFDELVQRVRSKNETMPNGNEHFREEIRVTAAKGYRAYDILDQSKLRSAIEELQVIEDAIDPPPPPQPIPESAQKSWLSNACKQLAEEALGYIENVERSKTIPVEVKTKLLATAPEDRSSLKRIIEAMKYLPGDQQANPHLSTVQQLHRKWDEIRNMEDGRPNE